MNSFLRRHAGLIGINLICLASLLPFLNKPFQVDDPLFLWSADHIVHHPLDPYGFDVNWYGRSQPMSRVMKNPPLMSYYLAAWSPLGGPRELMMHLAVLLPALGLASGTYLLARRLCAHPFAAAAATVLAPATLVSSTTVMCDVAMLCFYVWSVYFWVRGIDERRTGLLIIAAVFVALSALFKYFGVSLIPLLCAYALWRTRRVGAWALVMLIPIVLLAAYQQWTASLYGRGLLLDAAGYAAQVRWGGGAGWVAKALASFAFVGGCSATAVGIALATGRRRAATALGTAAVVALVAVLFFDPFPRQPGARPSNAGLWLTAQVALMAAAGFVVLWRAARPFWKWPMDAEAALLLLWAGGTLVFATLVNWSTNARVMMPIVPALAMLLLRRPIDAPSADQAEVDDADGEVARTGRFALAAGVCVGAALAIAAAVSDYSLAASVRRAADGFAARAASYPDTRWYLGHWGFQWYLEHHGFVPVDSGGSLLLPGAHIAVPLNNANVHKLPEPSYRTVERFVYPTAPWITVMNRSTGAGYYSDVWGPLPFAFGPAPAEEYREDEVTRRMLLRTE